MPGQIEALPALLNLTVPKGPPGEGRPRDFIGLWIPNTALFSGFLSRTNSRPVAVSSAASCILPAFGEADEIAGDAL